MLDSLHLSACNFFAQHVPRTPDESLMSPFKKDRLEVYVSYGSFVRIGLSVTLYYTHRKGNLNFDCSVRSELLPVQPFPCRGFLLYDDLVEKHYAKL